MEHDIPDSDEQWDEFFGYDPTRETDTGCYDCSQSTNWAKWALILALLLFVGLLALA